MASDWTMKKTSRASLHLLRESAVKTSHACSFGLPSGSSWIDIVHAEAKAVLVEENDEIMDLLFDEDDLILREYYLSFYHLHPADDDEFENDHGEFNHGFDPYEFYEPYWF